MAWSLKCFPESFSLRSDLVRRDQSDRRVVRFYWNLAMSQQFEKCAIYVRQSRVNDSSYSSCEAQLRICMDTAASFAWRVVDHFQDSGQSSETLARPEMQRLMACVELKQFEHLVVYSIDRLTRRLTDFARLMELFDGSGVKLTVVTDPQFGESAASRPIGDLPTMATPLISKCSSHLSERGENRRMISPVATSTEAMSLPLARLQRKQVQARFAVVVGPPCFTAMMWSGSWGRMTSSSWIRQYSQSWLALCRTSRRR